MTESYDPNTNPYLLSAEAALSLDLTGLQADANGAFGVVAMNLYDDPELTINAQDFLTVPDGGMTLLLLGIGLSGIAMVSQRMRR